MSPCLLCGNRPKRAIYKYCSNKCQQQYQYQAYIKDWKSGKVSGERGVVTKNISAHIRKYLRNVYGEQCSICKWDKKHAITKRVPLEIDHINGDAADNREENLRLLCPNCHSLSVNFRNLNKGKGRSWRTKKYIKAELAE